MEVPGAEALSTLLALRSREPAVTPVALGDDKDFERLLEAFEYSESPTEAVISAGLALDLPGWIRERIAADPEYYQEEQVDSAVTDEPEQARPLSLAFDVLSGKPKRQVHIALVPTAKPWEVPAYLKLGNWNECPAAEVHVAFFKSWFERYGAVVTGIGPDTVEFSVANPPETIEAARVLAREQFVYCADIVFQGVQSVENLAKVLVNSGNWYFWWD
nr:DUF4253 domain-containing protein [Pseudoxanthomonas sp.]